MSRLVKMQRVPLQWFALLLVLSMAGCPWNKSGGIMIKPNDMTPPSLTLDSGQAGGQNVSVRAGGTGQNMSLSSKTGALNLLATAKDSESGIHALEIWVNKKTTFCDANGSCIRHAPLLGRLAFESTSLQKNPGESSAESSILAQPLDLSKEIRQGTVPTGTSLRVELTIFAKAVNHQGGQTQTPEITVIWSEP